MKVKCYRTTKCQNTDVLDVEKIFVMPGPEDITDEDIQYADGAMISMTLKDGRLIAMPHHFIIKIWED